MIWFKKNNSVSDNGSSLPNNDAVVDESPVKKESFYDRLKEGLQKTRHHFGTSIERLLLGRKEIDTAVVEEIETQLISADFGTATVEELLANVTQGLSRKHLNDGLAVFQFLQQRLIQLLAPLNQPFTLVDADKPFVVLVVGVNGAGKTTTIAKLAHLWSSQGKKVLLAAGDTFRAAAIEQLQTWGKRLNIPVIAQQLGADSASVIYDALQSAKAKECDILIADTAGRLHTQSNLMDELKKIKRVLQKLDPTAPQEIMLVLDASIGQNAFNQAREFNQALGITGITITKLDGTAKGGILFAIAKELGIPFRYLGIGEGIDDLRPFDAQQFVRALFHHE